MAIYEISMFGEIEEYLVYPEIENCLEEFGFRFTSISGRQMRNDANGKCVLEIGMVLEDDTTMFVVDVNEKPSMEDIERQAEKLEKLREYIDREKGSRRILGAIAGAVFTTEQRLAALNAGFFVIVQSGDTMRMDIPEGFKPREW